VLIRVRQDTGEVGGQAHSIGVVIAQHPAHTGEGVLAELVRRLVLPPLLQDGGEAVGRYQRVGVVGSQDAAAAYERVLSELATLFIVAPVPISWWRGCWPISAC
jgi:hypothetical protein